MELIESFSGIRGVYNPSFREIAEKYAISFLEFLREKKNKEKPRIVIGRDTRHSGKEIFDIIASAWEGTILNVEIATTPIIENAVRALNADGGIIITASHNEPEFNGFKFLNQDGSVLKAVDADFLIKRKNEIKEIRNINKNQKAEILDKHKEAIESYKELIISLLKIDKINFNEKFLVDPNGGSGTISKEIFSDFGLNAEYINMEPGKFKRLIEPKKESLFYLVDELKKNNLSFAIGFDCDADRVEILDVKGNLIDGNQLLALNAEYILSETKDEEKKIVVVNDATSYLVKEIVEKLGGKIKEVEVGETNIVEEMEKTNALIGGEGSNGGVIISPSKCRDGILTFLFLLKLCEEKQKTLSELISQLPKYYYVKEKLKLSNSFFKIKDLVKEYYIKLGYKIQETGDETGGLKALKSDNSWIWFRQSKTEPNALRIISDSKSKKTSNLLIEEAKKLLKKLEK